MPSPPYETLASCLDVVRTQINDAIVSLGGQTFKNTAAFTPVYVNRGWQMLQQELLQLGYVRLLVEGLVLLNLPAIANLDTSIQASLSWSGYSDGVTNYTGIVLPQTLIKPTKLMERLSASAPNTNLFWNMSGPQIVPLITKDFRNRIWNWSADPITGNERIVIPGATGLIDLRIDFASYLPDFTGTGAGFPGAQVVPILRSTDALAWFIGFVFSYARNDDPAVCQFALDQARRAAAIVAGAKLPTQTMQVAA